MIKIDELTEKDIGRRVYYLSSDGRKEEGILKSWNNEYIFVVYYRNGKDIKERWWEFTSAATLPGALCFDEEDLNLNKNFGRRIKMDVI